MFLPPNPPSQETIDFLHLGTLGCEPHDPNWLLCHDLQSKDIIFCNFFANIKSNIIVPFFGEKGIKDLPQKFFLYAVAS